MIYYGADVTLSLDKNPPYWPWRLTQQWVGVHTWIPHTPCDFFHGLLFLLWSYMILSNYNCVGWFWKILFNKGLFGVLDYLDVSLEHKPVLVI